MLVYVAGFDRGVRPIGDWSILIIFSICLIPFTFLCLPGLCFPRYRFFAKDLDNISFTNVLFPEPDTPVTTVIKPIGNFADTFLRLFSAASTTSKIGRASCRERAKITVG